MIVSFSPHRLSILVAGLVLYGSLNLAAQAPDVSSKADLLAGLKRLDVQPTTLALTGPRDMRQLIVTGHFADGTVRDLTGACDYSLADAVATVLSDGLIRPVKNGTTSLTIKAGSQTAKVDVAVHDFDQPKPVGFRHDVIAALNVGGCNAGACHGTPAGKNGFKLSPRGYDPAADYNQLTRDVLGRRTNVQNPDSSLILLKGLGQVAHEGGTRFGPHSDPARTLRAWMAEGLQDDADEVAMVRKLEVVPGSRVLQAPSQRQQLAVRAYFSDGSIRDVTRLTVFSSSDPNLAQVSATGLVDFIAAGEVAVLCRYLETMGTVSLAYLEPKKGFAWSNPPEHNYVDKHVFAKLKMLSIQPSSICKDDEFIRRVYLDVCAVLPTPDEVRSFLADTDKNKRAKLIDRLLDRPEYADFWTLKWMDVLRNSRRNLGIKGAEAYQKWMNEHFKKNTPFDQVVRELLTSDGNTFEKGQANYYRVVRAPEELAESTAQLFLGVRMQCSKCHNHPFEKWTQDDYYSTAAFFARVKSKTTSGGKPNPKKLDAEIVFADKTGDVKHLRTGQIMEPRFLGGRVPMIDKDKDRREVFADWLVAPENPFFARSVVNRLWYHVMGRGIVDPPDDFRDSNPSANDALLDALAKDFVAKKFDVKHILRTILNSRSYQLSALSNEFNKDDTKYFSHPVPKLLTAEQLLDAICQATEEPEKFQGFPAGTRAVQLPDGDVNHPFLKAFGQPARELPCECEREGDANLGQALQFINGATVNAKLTSNKNRITRLLAKKVSESEMLNELYLATLSRLPTAKETQFCLDAVRAADDKRKAWEDVQWTLFNTKEFMFRH
jgi:hypothetical protein